MHINGPQNVSSCNYLPQKPDIGDDVFIIYDPCAPRFPLNGFCKVTALQVITQLLNFGFELRTSNGAGAGGELGQLAEYVFTRQITHQ